MPRYPRPEGFGPRGARDDRVGEILHDSDEEIVTRDRSPSPQYIPTREYTVPPAPPPSPVKESEKRPEGRTEEQIAKETTRVEEWVAGVEHARVEAERPRLRRRDTLKAKARAVLLLVFRKR